MKKYIIPDVNSSLEITNPTIEIVGLSQGNPKVKEPLDFINKTYSVDIILKDINFSYGFMLKNIQAISMDFENGGNDIVQQVVDALDSQFLV